MHAQFAYVANSGDNTVSGYVIDPVTGALKGIAGSPFLAGAEPNSVAVDPSGKFAYVANLSGNTVSGYTISPASGALTAIAGSPFAEDGSEPFSVAVDPSGKFAYVANMGGNVSGYYDQPGHRGAHAHRRFAVRCGGLAQVCGGGPERQVRLCSEFQW